MSKRPLLALLLPLLAAGPVWAQTTVDQAKALAGGITPGDTPGFPITLSVPGSYKLTSNLMVPASTSGVLITASNVTLDLNGFSVIGPVNCTLEAGQLVCMGAVTGSARGISSSGVTNTIVRHGHVAGFAQTGIDIRDGILQDLTVESNHGTGIFAGTATSEADSSVRISGVHVRLNSSVGINARHGIIERAVVSGNLLGMYGCSFSVIDSLVDKNLSQGLQGFSNTACLPPAVKGSVLQQNGGASLSGPVRTMGGNLVDGVAF